VDIVALISTGAIQWLIGAIVSLGTLFLAKNRLREYLYSSFDEYFDQKLAELAEEPDKLVQFLKPVIDKLLDQTFSGNQKQSKGMLTKYLGPTLGPMVEGMLGQYVANMLNKGAQNAVGGLPASLLLPE
jgi:hypothetical protein